VESGAVVNTDPTLLRRVVQNFVSNAIRYTRRGGVVIGCRRRGNALRLEVWDSGRGIPSDKLREIFGEFRRLDTGDADSQNGLGLGLAIVERIAKTLGHPVDVRSRPGRGSVFAITLPLADAAAAARPLDKPARLGLPNLLAGKLILCIDNDPSVLAGTRSLLEAWSCSVLVASDFASALASIEGADRIPDVVLLDYHLGADETGLDVLDRLRASTGRGFKAMLITADHSEAVRSVAQARGLPLLHKPLSPAALRALLSRLATQPAEDLSHAG